MEWEWNGRYRWYDRCVTSLSVLFDVMSTHLYKYSQRFSSGLQEADCSSLCPLSKSSRSLSSFSSSYQLVGLPNSWTGVQEANHDHWKSSSSLSASSYAALALLKVYTKYYRPSHLGYKVLRSVSQLVFL